MQAIAIFVAVHIILILFSINSTAVSVAFPALTAHFDTSLVLAGWVLSIYQLVAVCSMVLMGKISDVFGRKNTFLVCTGLFLLGSLFAALAPNIQFLIASRFIQSLGGGGLLPAIMGIIADKFPRHRIQAIGVSMTFFNIGGIVGPNIGSWLVTSYGWQSVFMFNVPIGVIFTIPLFFLLKHEEKRTAQHIEYTGAGLLSGFLFTFMIGLSQIAHSDSITGWLTVALLFAASGFFLWLLVRHELRAKDPIIDLVFLRKRVFAAANIYNFILGSCIFGFTSLIPLYAVTVYAMSTAESGIVMMVRSVGTLVASLLSSFLLVSWGYRKPMLLGSIIISASLILLGLEFSGLSIFGMGISAVVLVSVIALANGIGMGISAPASNNACLDLMPERTSTITGVRGMFRQGGGAISIAIITLVLQYMGDMAAGFKWTFLATGLLVLATIPFVYALPDKAAPQMAVEKEA